MWGAISRIFHKPNGKIGSSNEDIIMDRGEGKKHLEPEAESHATRHAKQRATIKWLLSKAYNNRVPENLREPFYRNHEDQEHLKPAVVHYLANAELYCMALSNIYSDPNYNNLNHWGILQALARKGVHISDPHITETVLIQTTPIKLSAHVRVMQGVMSLYAREVATPELISCAVERFSTQQGQGQVQVPADHEAALCQWASSAVLALHHRLQEKGEKAELPEVKEITDLCDGAGLAALIAFYCPERLEPSAIRLGPHPTVSDCVRNLSMVSEFCASHLPTNIFHMAPEELYYMRGSLRQNLVVFLADLFNMLEIHPAQCVTLNSAASYPANAEGRNSQGVAHKRSLPQPVSAIPDLRPGIDSPSSFSGSPVLSSGSLRKSSQNHQADSSSENRITGNGNCSDEFVVHRGRGVPTLSSVLGGGGGGETNGKTAVGGGGPEPVPAGKPTHWEPRKPSYAGRRSRRNSLSDDSQLTLENFGGSEENLHLLGRNPDKEPAVHSGRRETSARSSVADNSSDVFQHALHEDEGSEPLLPSRRASLSRTNSFTENQRRAEEMRASDGVFQSLVESTQPPPLSPPTPVPDSPHAKFYRRQSSVESQRRVEEMRSSDGVQQTLFEPPRSPPLIPALSPPTVSPEPPPPVRSRTLSRNNSFVESQRRAMELSSEGVQSSLFETPPSPTAPEPPPRTALSRDNSFVEPPQRRPVEEVRANILENATSTNGREKKVTTFAALPQNTTTWQQQSLAHQGPDQLDNGMTSRDSPDNGLVVGSQLLNIRLKLEEKRRRIEAEKRKMEAQMSRTRQKVGKAAFLQAVSKGKGVGKSPPEPAVTATTSAPPAAPAELGPRDPPTRPGPSQLPLRPFSLKEISEVEQKWLGGGDSFSEERKTPDLDNMDIETYQNTIAQMNSSLHEIQADLQRLADQQQQQQQMMSQPQQQQQRQAVVHQQQQQPPHPQQRPPLPQQPPPQQQQPQMSSFASLGGGSGGGGSGYTTRLVNFTSHHSPQPSNHHYQHPQMNQMQNYQEVPSQDMNYPPQQASSHNFGGYNSHQTQQQPNYNNGGGVYLHGSPQQPSSASQQQQQQQIHSLINSNFNSPQQGWHSLSQQPTGPPPPPPQQHNYNTYTTRYNNQGFSLHSNYPGEMSSPVRENSGSEFYLHEPAGAGGGGGSAGRRTWGQPFTPDPTSWARREAVSLENSPKQNGSETPTPPPRLSHAPLPTPPVDDMEPQSISFIGSGEDGEQLMNGLSKLNISSGSRTYRIPSPTRSVRSSVQGRVQQSGGRGAPVQQQPSVPAGDGASPNSEKQEQGFYISFDEDAPKRPKPPLRVKRGSPKKERNLTQTLEPKTVSAAVNEAAGGGEMEDRRRVVHSPPGGQQQAAGGRASLERVPLPHEAPIVIGSHPDPTELDEMEKKKERILMLSLQRRQAAEEARARKEAEAARRRDHEKAKEEEKLRKKEEDRRRRAAILERHKIKKAIEEADREGKQVDKELLNSLKASLPGLGGGHGSGGPPRLRSKAGPARPRPKTIHIDSAAVEEPPPLISSARGKKGSSSNLSALNSPVKSSMRRDYYRGSQDSLAEIRKPSRLYPENGGDESRGTSPGRSLGRRSSYRTSRDASPETSGGRGGRVGARGAPQHSASRLRSSSLMNLAGSSSDQDSLAYRYTDTDSGLGRATPPRRVPSPSGPGSLPAVGRRRPADDSMSDAGSDYSGPRLYRQPATKSNKGIVLNAVEYCVFPGAVNREAKQRVIEEMNRSEAKHFLVLFRDAGCQFRALYAYWPDTEEIIKLYGTGPKVVNDSMFDKFFKYNSGGKCFSQVHTKHLTVTIDAFTIHNVLWQGKKVNLPNKKDMTLVI